MRAEPAPELRSAEVARRLETYIIEHAFTPGDRLPSERELATRFGVSRTAIREGIKLLTQSGLLESSVGRGLFVREVSAGPLTDTLNVLAHQTHATARYVVEVRNALETLAARLAAVYATEEDLARLDTHLVEMAVCLASNRGYSEVGPAFHLDLARASHNPLLALLIEPLMALSTRRDPQAVGGSPTRQGLENHREIVAALRSRDPDRAQRAIEHHSSYLMALRNQLNPEWEQIVLTAHPQKGGADSS
jgi:GntR family transcriptional repressor for pyruvate dehydrogenase complex